MSAVAEKVAEVLALPEEARAYLAHELIASLDDTVDADAETKWQEVIDRRSREIEQGQVTCAPVDETVRDIRARLHARRQPSRSVPGIGGRGAVVRSAAARVGGRLP